MRIKEGIIVPVFQVDKRYTLLYKGVKYHYTVRDGYFLNRILTNDAILVAIWGEGYKYKLEEIYGHPPILGVWPEWVRSDTKEVLVRLQKAFEKEGVTILEK